MVFIPGVFQGSIPHSRAEDMDEERRLLYVAMTRAQGLLYMSYPTENTRKGISLLYPFPFLLVEQDISNYDCRKIKSVSLS